jgi:hypothetical protein
LKVSSECVVRPGSGSQPARPVIFSRVAGRDSRLSSTVPNGALRGGRHARSTLIAASLHAEPAPQTLSTNRTDLPRTAARPFRVIALHHHHFTLPIAPVKSRLAHKMLFIWDTTVSDTTISRNRYSVPIPARGGGRPILTAVDQSWLTPGQTCLLAAREVNGPEVLR